MARRAHTAWVATIGLALGYGCGFDAAGTNTPPAPGLGVQETTGPAGEPDDPADDSGDESAGLSGGSGGADPTGVDTSNTTDPTEGNPTTGDSGASDSGGDETGNGDDGGSSGGIGGMTPPTEAFVENVDLSQCESSVGCWAGNGKPAAPFLPIECYDSPVPLPYELDRIHVDVGWVDYSFDDVQVQVRDRLANGEPGDAVWSGWLSNPPDEGMNMIPITGELPRPTTQGFCVGFYVPDGGWDGGIEFSTNSAQSAGSFYGGCDASSWNALGGSGGWCMGVGVQAISL